MYAAFTYVYQAPNLSQIVGLKPLKWVTDNWELSGVTQIKSNIQLGYPTVNFSNTNATRPLLPNATGTSGEGARRAPRRQHQSAQRSGLVPGRADHTNIGVNGTPGNALFNNAAFQIPLPVQPDTAGDPRLGIGQDMSCFGNAGAGQLLTIPGTGVNNWDMTFTKRFPFKTDSGNCFSGAEMYNIFNHTQFLGASLGQSYSGPRTRPTVRWSRPTAARDATTTPPRLASCRSRCGSSSSGSQHEQGDRSPSTSQGRRLAAALPSRSQRKRNVKIGHTGITWVQPPPPRPPADGAPPAAGPGRRRAEAGRSGLYRGHL